jgi:O-antigen ligase
MTASFPPVWNTFIHSWRSEFFASIFLSLTLCFYWYFTRNGDMKIDLSPLEIRLIVLPMAALILWSALSATWANSWRSAIHHSFVWSEYLIFFVVVRGLLKTPNAYRDLIKIPMLTLAFFGTLAVVGYCAYLVFGPPTSLGIVYAKYGEQVNTIFPLAFLGVLLLRGRTLVLGSTVLVFLWLLVFCSLSRIDLALFVAVALSAAFVVFSVPRFRVYRLKAVGFLTLLAIAPLPLHIFSLYSSGSGVAMVDRLSNTSHIQGSNDFRKLMLSIGTEMIAAHPMVGVGADNFGFEANRYRVIYASRNPDDPDLAEAEDTIPERAHNEYLQVTAELGIVGAAILFWFLTAVAIMLFRARRLTKTSPFALAALTGVCAFLVSSLVTSYSFRLIQNGFVFFFVLAVASSRLLRSSAVERTKIGPIFSTKQLKLAFAAGIAASLLLTTYCAVRVASVAYYTEANSIADLDTAYRLYDTAMWLDDEDPDARYFLGLRLVDKARYSEAIPYLKSSIAIGKAPSADFSYLASAQSLAGDQVGAEETFAEAVSLYPRSPFVLTRYAALLKSNGKSSESDAELERAKRIDFRQANSWWIMLTQSPQAATDLALKSSDYAPLMDLNVRCQSRT